MVEFEALVPMQNTRDWDNLDKTATITEKAGFIYGKSLERLRIAGYERHASPSEAFSLLADNLEGKLNGKLKEIADDMYLGFGEWLSMAFERKDDLLIVYLHPEGIVWDKGKYQKQSSFKYGVKMEFDITGKKSNTWIPLQEMEDSFSFLVYSRDFNDLPEAMKEGSKTAHIALPANGRFCPISNDLYNLSSRFNIDGTGKWASRGVKRAAGNGRIKGFNDYSSLEELIKKGCIMKKI